MGMEIDRGDPTHRLLVDARPHLWRAFVAVRGEHGADEAVAEAMAWGWEHRQRLSELDNPIGYLYRVGLTRSAARSGRNGSTSLESLPDPGDVGLPHVEPGLVPALLSLPERQREAIWLVHACGWTHAETAEALGIARTTVGTHVDRAMRSLRQKLEVTIHG